MADDIAKAAVEVAASVSGAGTPDQVRVARSTRLSEWSLFVCLVVLTAMALFLIAILTWLPPGRCDQSIWFLGWALLIAVAGILLIIGALCSPWIGRMEASAGPAHLNLEGRS